MEGDRRCAEKLKGLIAHIIAFPRWYSVSYATRKPIPWHSDLFSTAAALALGRIYELIYETLTPEERDTLARGIFEKGVLPAFSDWVLPGTRIHAVDSMGHNWWAACIGEAATALLAIRDHLPKAQTETLLSNADAALAAFLTYPGNPLFNKFRNYDAGGLFYESASYGSYATGSVLRYLWCSERCRGENETIRAALPAGFCDAQLQFTYPRSSNAEKPFAFLNFGDCSFENDIDLVIKGAVQTGLASAAAGAFAATLKTNIWEEIAGFDFSRCKGSLATLPKTVFFPAGYAISRSAWEPDATVFAVKSGYCWNHSHNDAGTFSIFYKGKPFIIDSGSSGTYDHPLYHAYYCQSAAHNVLLVGERGSREEELYRGTKFPGAIIDHYAGGDLVFVQADATGPMAHLCSRMYRSFFWIDNRLLVIVDDVYCHREDTVQFTLHYNGTYRQVDDAVFITYEDRQARLIAHSGRESLTEQKGHPEHEPDQEQAYLSFCSGESKRTHTLIHTLELAPDEHPTSFTRLTGENASGLLISDGETQREIWFNHQADGYVMHDNSNNILGGYETDVYLLFLTRNKKADSPQRGKRFLFATAVPEGQIGRR